MSLTVQGVGRVVQEFTLEEVTSPNGAFEPYKRAVIRMAFDPIGGSNSGEATFIDVLLTRNRAIAAAQFLHVGQPVHVRGELAIRTGQRQSGDHAGSWWTNVRIERCDVFSWLRASDGAKPACPALYQPRTNQRSAAVVSVVTADDLDPQLPDSVDDLVESISLDNIEVTDTGERSEPVLTETDGEPF